MIEVRNSKQTTEISKRLNTQTSKVAKYLHIPDFAFLGFASDFPKLETTG